MEVHIRNVPEQGTETTLKRALKPYFQNLFIQSVHVQKSRSKPFASLTFLHNKDAETFLKVHGQPKVPRNQPRPRNTNTVNIKYFGRPLYCEKSDRSINPYLKRVLEKEEKDRIINAAALVVQKEPNVLPVFFDSIELSCGVWNYENEHAVFEPQLTWVVRGSIKFGPHSTILTLDKGIRIDFIHGSTLLIATEDGFHPSLIFSMLEAPRFFQKIEDSVADLLAKLGINGNRNAMLKQTQQQKDRHRLPALGAEHQKIAGSCLVYRVALQENQTEFYRGNGVSDKMQALRKVQGMPPIIHRQVHVRQPVHPFLEGFTVLMNSFSSFKTELPFVIQFQVQKLAQEAYLPPHTVIQLLPEIRAISKRSGIGFCVRAIRKLFIQIDIPGPNTDSEAFHVDALIEQLRQNEQQIAREEAMVAKEVKPSANVALIHKAKVTPSGLRLSGPEPEANNRVLRKYPNHHEYFLRVQFCDEDGKPVRYNPRISNERIFGGRFEDVLRNGIKIAGREYGFLGFSHSSLRAQSCWFMAPFISEGTLLWDRIIIQNLGDFAGIRSPAKCAARIGQVFSDTRTAVSVDQSIVKHIPDVKANGRVFSDGVGMMSTSVMFKIWDSLPAKHLVKPTLFQIRYQGAKGMISLDTRLEKDTLALRPSMIKFDGSTWPDIEICEVPYKPLSVYLNRQFIKILEDMGVDDEFFLQLQADEVRRLKSITSSPVNASTFLKRHSIGDVVHLPWFIGDLGMIGLDFQQDPFLRDVLQMALLIELRLLKHKTRIPIEHGWHLHGLMDETGFLEEGQIYCTATVEGLKTSVIGKDLIISRAPALHPGDVQLAEGVMPPDGSPLRELVNCICFSSKGARDLPSMLSGGDLDGDRYYIIWDERCKPKQHFQPADYPRVEPINIGRTVERDDMTNFFVQFMETDQLGRIAVMHRILADQMLEGTLHPDCITLAEMHSTAVDFSKTGIPVDMSRLPKANRYRPDFEAPGPHVIIEKSEGLCFELDEYQDPEEPGDEDDDFTNYRYYESKKVLGKLYRAIDERKIFEDIKQRAMHRGETSESSVIDAVWAYVQQRCLLIEWKHKLDWARDIRDMYEETLTQTMTEYSEHPSRPLTELEAFIGNILGKTGAQTKHQRELSTTMKEKFDGDAAFIVNCIVKDDAEWSEEALERSMACLAVSLEDKKGFRRAGELVSFRYVAAAVCLREVDRLPA